MIRELSAEPGKAEKTSDNPVLIGRMLNNAVAGVLHCAKTRLGAA